MTNEEIAQAKLDAHNKVMLADMTKVIRAFNKNPNDPVASANFHKALEFYRDKSGDKND